MARKKVQLAWIENQTARKATFRKRRENLIKKVKEISVLAGTDACGIILSPFEGDPPLFYPPAINEILTRFFALPEIDQFKRMVTIESYMKDEITKLKEMVQKERRNVREVEVSYTMNSIHVHGRPIETLSCDETSELFWYFEELKKKCELRINTFDNSNVAPPGPQPVAPSMPVVQGSHENVMNDPWLAGNYNMMGGNMPPNYDYDINPNGNNGFGDLSDIYATNIGDMAGANFNDLPYIPQPSFGSSHHAGLMSDNAMAGPSSTNPPFPEPPVGFHQGFFSNNSGY